VGDTSVFLSLDDYTVGHSLTATCSRRGSCLLDVEQTKPWHYDRHLPLLGRINFHRGVSIIFPGRHYPCAPAGTSRMVLFSLSPTISPCPLVTFIVLVLVHMGELSHRTVCRRRAVIQACECVISYCSEKVPKNAITA